MSHIGTEFCLECKGNTIFGKSHKSLRILIDAAQSYFYKYYWTIQQNQPQSKSNNSKDGRYSKFSCSNLGDQFPAITWQLFPRSWQVLPAVNNTDAARHFLYCFLVSLCFGFLTVIGTTISRFRFIFFNLTRKS